jgi:hypothetical protein
MSTEKRKVLILVLALVAGVALVTGTWAAPGAAPMAGGAPTVVAYQGEVRVNGIPYNGDGYFKFAVVNAARDMTCWSNDGSSIMADPPAAAVQLPVTDGLFSVLLGDTNLGGMTEPLTAGDFSEPDRYLKIWFSTSVGGPFSHLSPDSRIAAVPYALQAERVRGYAGVVVVAKSGGDQTSVQVAIDSITDASAANPYLVWVAPGQYEEQVTMKPHVHLQGAGQEATIIHSSASAGWPVTEATLILASDTSLRDLTVSNNGAGLRNVALLAMAGTEGTMVADVTARAHAGGTMNFGLFLIGSGTDVALQRVTALAENATSGNYGLYNFDAAVATLRGGSFTGRGGIEAHGIKNSGGGTALEAVDVTALGEDSSDYSYGLYNETGAAALRGGSFIARGGTNAYGISSGGSGTMLEADSVSALGENASVQNTGLRNNEDGTATLRGGSFTGRGATYALGILNYGATLDAESITTLGENGDDSYGLLNSNGAAVALRGGSFTGRGGTNAHGIKNYDSGTTLEAESVTALGDDGSGDNYGLYNETDAAATLRGGSFTGRGGSYAYGLRNSGTLVAERVSARGNFGLRNNSGSATVESSQFAGDPGYALVQDSGTVGLALTLLSGWATRNGGSLNCYIVYLPNYTFYPCP